MPTVVAGRAATKTGKLNDPITYNWKFKAAKDVEKRVFNQWKKYVYSYLSLAFSWLAKYKEGNYAIPRTALKDFFCDGGVFDFTKEKNGQPDVNTTDKLLSLIHI